MVNDGEDESKINYLLRGTEGWTPGQPRPYMLHHWRPQARTNFKAGTRMPKVKNRNRRIYISYMPSYPQGLNKYFDNSRSVLRKPQGTTWLHRRGRKKFPDFSLTFPWLPEQNSSHCRDKYPMFCFTKYIHNHIKIMLLIDRYKNVSFQHCVVKNSLVQGDIFNIMKIMDSLQK